MTTRREFLTQAGLFTAAALAAPALARAAMGGHTVGLQLYTLREQLPKDVKGVIAKVAEAGYKEVETFGYSKKGGHWGLSTKEFKSLLSAHGLTTPSGHYGMDQLLGEDKWDDVKDYIDVAKTLGQEYVTCPYVNEKFRKTPDDFKKIAEKLNKAAELCKKSGLKMGYHNHNFEFIPVDGTMLYSVLLKDTDPNLVHFEMDLYWVVRAGQDPVKWMHEHSHRFAMVHVKDMDKTDSKLNTEVGNGSIDYKRIIPVCKKVGVKHFIMEQENFKIDPYVSIKESCNYMKNKLMV